MKLKYYQADDYFQNAVKGKKLWGAIDSKNAFNNSIVARQNFSGVEPNKHRYSIRNLTAFYVTNATKSGTRPAISFQMPSQLWGALDEGGILHTKWCSYTGCLMVFVP